VPSGAGPASSSREPRKGCSAVIAEPPAPASTGLAAFSSHDQVLRNHAVGRTCTVSASGPALVTRTVIKTSVGSALAYQTSVIQ
jgi:hypothetical protein